MAAKQACATSAEQPRLELGKAQMLQLRVGGLGKSVVRLLLFPCFPPLPLPPLLSSQDCLPSLHLQSVALPLTTIKGPGACSFRWAFLCSLPRQQSTIIGMYLYTCEYHERGAAAA